MKYGVTQDTNMQRGHYFDALWLQRLSALKDQQCVIAQLRGMLVCGSSKVSHQRRICNLKCTIFYTCISFKLHSIFYTYFLKCSIFSALSSKSAKCFLRTMCVAQSVKSRCTMHKIFKLISISIHSAYYHTPPHHTCRKQYIHGLH